MMKINEFLYKLQNIDISNPSRLRMATRAPSEITSDRDGIEAIAEIMCQNSCSFDDYYKLSESLGLSQCTRIASISKSEDGYTFSYTVDFKYRKLSNPFNDAKIVSDIDSKISDSIIMVRSNRTGKYETIKIDEFAYLCTHFT